jgi:hypothetical protein
MRFVQQGLGHLNSCLIYGSSSKQSPEEVKAGLEETRAAVAAEAAEGAAHDHAAREAARRIQAVTEVGLLQHFNIT